MKKIKTVILTCLFLPTLAFGGCTSKEVTYRLTDGNEGEGVSPVLRDHQTLGTFELEDGVASIDTEKPRILIKADYANGIEAASKYVSVPSVIAVDNQDSDPFVYVTATTAEGEKVQFTDDGRFYAPTLGVYVFHYNCMDSSGNEADEVVLSVEVKDSTAPVINLRSFTDGIKGLRYNTVKLPSVLVSDYAECDLKVEVGKVGTNTFEEVDRYALAYKPTEIGDYVIRYTATEKSEFQRSTVAEIPLTVTELTLMSACEENVLAGWGFSDPTGTAKPTKSVDLSEYTEGKGSTLLTYRGSAAQAAVVADGSGIRAGMTAYLDFLREGSDDVSGYKYVQIDVYNANESTEKVQLWVMDQNRKGVKATPVEIPAKSWMTLELEVSMIEDKGYDASAMLSVLLTFEAHDAGVWSFNVDNFRASNESARKGESA